MIQRSNRTVVLGAFLALVGGAAPTLVAQADVDAIAKGARVYGATCGRCHNPRSPLERTDQDWIVIANHMRVRANLTGAELRSVLAFLQATNGDPGQVTTLPPSGEAGPEPEVSGHPISTDPEVIAAGEALVQQRACLGCHVIGDNGGAVGPGLNSVVSRRGVDFLRRKLADPTFNKATSMMPNFGLTPEQIEAVLAYLATFNR